MTERSRDDFEFYLKFTKQLILGLSDVKDRILAAAWVQKLRNEQIGTSKLRTDYLKLLLFSLQRKHLVGPFGENPDYVNLEEFPSTYKLHDIAKALIEEEHLEELTKKRSGGDYPPITGECSANLLEYAACQDIPNFGVQAFYAISNEPIHKWNRLHTAIIPKPMEEVPEKLIIPSMSATTNVTSEPSREDIQKEVSVPGDDASPKISRRSPSPVPVLGDKPLEDEDFREPPTWGSNLLTVSESPERDDASELDLNEFEGLEGIDMKQLKRDLAVNVDDLFDECADEEDYAELSKEPEEEMDFNINFGIMGDDEFDNYMEMLKKQEEELLAEIEDFKAHENDPSPKFRKSTVPFELPRLPSPPMEKRKSPRMPSAKSPKSPPKLPSPEPQKLQKKSTSSKIPCPGTTKKRSISKIPSVASRGKKHKAIPQGSSVTSDIIEDANATFKQEREKMKLPREETASESFENYDMSNQGLSIRYKANAAVKQATEDLRASPALANLPVTTPARSPSPARVLNVLGDAEYFMDEEILDIDNLDTEFDSTEPLSIAERIRMEVPLDVGTSSLLTDRRQSPLPCVPSTSRIPSPVYVSPERPKAIVTRKGKALAKGTTRVKSSGMRTMGVDPYQERLLERDARDITATAPSDETVTISLNRRKVISDSPQKQYRLPSPQERLIPQLDFQSPPPYQPPSPPKNQWPLYHLGGYDEDLLTMESIDLYESPSPEQPLLSPGEAARIREQRSCFESQLFEEADLFDDRLDEEQMDYEEVLRPEDVESLHFMSELRQHPSKRKINYKLNLEARRSENMRKRQDMTQFPLTHPKLRGKTTRRSYGYQPRVSPIKEYYDGPVEPIYDSAKRKVPLVYPSVMSPPSAEKNPIVFPERHRYESPQRAPAKRDLYEKSPSRKKLYDKRTLHRPRRLDFNQTERTPSPPMQLTKSPRQRQQPCPAETAYTDVQIKEAIYSKPRVKDLLSFKMGEYDDYVSPPKPSILDEDNPRYGLHEPLISHEYGWKSPEKPICLPEWKKSPRKKTLIRIVPRNEVRITDETFPYEDMPFDDDEFPQESPGARRSSRSSASPQARREQQQISSPDLPQRVLSNLEIRIGSELFEAADSFNVSLDEEQLEYEELLEPEDEESLNLMSELRQHQNKRQINYNVDIEQRRAETVRKRQDMTQFPLTHSKLRGKTTRRSYGYQPRVSPIKEYYDGPLEPIYDSPRRRVPPVYPSVRSPPSAEKDPCVLPELRRYESPRRTQPKPDAYEKTPCRRKPSDKRTPHRPRKLDYNQTEPATSPQTHLRTPSRETQHTYPTETTYTDAQIKEAIYSTPRPRDMMSFKLGEYDFYVSPPKPTILDEDNPRFGLHEPLLKHEYGWKSPDKPICLPEWKKSPSKKTHIHIIPGNEVRITDETFPYEDMPFDDEDIPQISPGRRRSPSPRASPRADEFSAESAAGSSFPLEQQISHVEGLLKEYEKDVEEDKRRLLSPDRNQPQGVFSNLEIGIGSELFEEAESFNVSLDEEQMDYEELLEPEDEESLQFMSQLRQHQNQRNLNYNVDLETRRMENIRRRQDMSQFPKTHPKLRGKMTRRSYGQQPAVSPVIEKYDGPIEPIYDSPRRRVPPVYPSVITPPSAEKSPCIFPELRRFESPRRIQPRQDHYEKTPCRKKLYEKRTFQPTRRLDFDQPEPGPSPRMSLSRVPQQTKQWYPAENEYTDTQIKEAIYSRPRPSDLMSFDMGEYDYYVSPPKPSVLDEDVPQFGLHEPLISYQHGWKSPEYPVCPPGMKKPPRKTTVISISPRNEVRITDESFPYEDMPFEENETLRDSPRRCKTPPPRASPQTSVGTAGSSAGTSFPIEQQMSYVEDLLKGYEKDVEEQKRELIPPAPTVQKRPRREIPKPKIRIAKPAVSAQKSASPPSQKCPSPPAQRSSSPSSQEQSAPSTSSAPNPNVTPPLIARRRLILQRKLFDTYNELDNLFDESAAQLYQQEECSPLSQPLSLYQFREKVRTEAKDARYVKRRARRRLNLANSFNVPLTEDLEGEERENQDSARCNDNRFNPPSVEFDYLSVLGLDEDINDE